MSFKKVYCLYLVTLFGHLSLVAQTDTLLFPGDEGSSLLSKLQNNFTPSAVLEYGPARDIMYSEIYNVDDSLSCVYSGHTLYVNPNADPSSFVFMNGSDDGINAEHTWPRSKGASEGAPLADMHHLYPTRALVNEVRSNFPFGDIPDEITDFWYINNQELRTKPTNNLDAYSEYKFGTFEPREQHKGNVARAMFYFYTIYRSEAVAADRDFFDEQRATLCDWHYLDPVDSLEYERTFAIAAYQDDKPNPFVLDCTLAKRLYCSDVDLSCADLTVNTFDLEDLLEEKVSVIPNPNNGKSQIAFELKTSAVVELKVVNMLGQAIEVRTRQQLGPGAYQWDLTIQEAGVYTSMLSIRKNGQVKIIPNRIIVH